MHDASSGLAFPLNHGRPSLSAKDCTHSQNPHSYPGSHINRALNDCTKGP